MTKKEVNVYILRTWESNWSSLVMSGYTPSITIKSVQQKKVKIKIYYRKGKSSKKNKLILSSCSMLGPSHPPNPLLQFENKNLLLA